MTDAKEALEEIALEAMENAMDVDVGLNELAAAVAPAILAAMPEILKGMVKPLEFIGVEADCFVHCESMGYSYELIVFDTLEMPHHYTWQGEAKIGMKTTALDAGSRPSFADVVEAANAHRVATILSALGVTV